MKTLKTLETSYDLNKCKLEAANRELCDRLDKYTKTVNELVLEKDEVKELLESYQATKITQTELLDGIVKNMVSMVESYIIREYQNMCCKQGYKFSNIKEFIDFQKEYVAEIRELTNEELLNSNDEMIEDIGKDNFIFITRQSMVYYTKMVNELESLLQWSVA